MSVKKELGKITLAEFGFGGYDSAMMGLNLVFQGDGWGTGDFKGTWSYRPDYVDWTEETQLKIWGETVKFLVGILKAAKVKDVTGLKGVPVEVTFTDMKLTSWRILEEVL